MLGGRRREGGDPQDSQLIPTNHTKQELRLLCLGPAEELPGSRLLERYHETLSSMVRYELKKVGVGSIFWISYRLSGQLDKLQ